MGDRKLWKLSDRKAFSIEKTLHWKACSLRSETPSNLQITKAIGQADRISQWPSDERLVRRKRSATMVAIAIAICDGEPADHQRLMVAGGRLFFGL